MSEKSIYMRDTLSLIASDLSTTTLEIMFDEVDALVELAKDREREAIKDMRNPAFLKNHNIHTLVSAVVQVILKNRINVNNERENCVFRIHKINKEYDLAWYSNLKSRHIEKLHCDCEIETFDFDTLNEVVEFIDQLRVDDPEEAKKLDEEVKEYLQEFEYLWDPRMYC